MNNFYPDFSKQYNKTYKARLDSLRPLISTPKDTLLCDRIHDLDNQTDDCLIKGILFISSDLKTTIFDELNPDNVKADLKKCSYISKDVKYFVEDETGRIEIIFNSKDFVCTGMCLGFRGKMVDSKFKVSQFICPDVLCTTPKNNKSKIAFISGLEVSGENNNSPYLRVISDYLDHKGITTLIIFGQFFKDDFEFFRKTLETLNINIILIPEYSDFGCKTFPLLPVHKKLVKALTSYTVPSIVNLEGSVFSFSSLKIIEDLLKYIPQNISDLQNEADGYRMHLDESKIDTTPCKIQDLSKDNLFRVAQGILKSRIMCPSGPDTLPTVPYNNSEIFLIDRPIDYFFIPNCNSELFSVDENTGCRVVSIPNFSMTRKTMILDLEKNDYEFVEFTI